MPLESWHSISSRGLLEIFGWEHLVSHCVHMTNSHTIEYVYGRVPVHSYLDAHLSYPVWCNRSRCEPSVCNIGVGDDHGVFMLILH